MAALAGPIVGSCLPCLGFQAQQAHGSLRRQRTASATRSGLFQVSTVAKVLPHGGCPCAHRGDCGTSADGSEGIEAMIAMDISNSMLAEDAAPSRLERSKRLVEDLLNRFTNDKIGLVVFAGDAFVQLPITADYVSAKMFLDNISPSLIGTQGTDIGKAIDLSMHSFTQNSKFGKAIIIITDGENHEGGAEEMARKAQQAGIRVFVLGIGSTQGAPIPMDNGSYLQDKDGQTVMTKLNEDMCKKLAEAGKGMYIHVDNTTGAEQMLDNEIAKMQHGEIESMTYSDYAEQFPAIAAIVLLLLIAEALMRERQNPLLNRMNLFTKK